MSNKPIDLRVEDGSEYPDELQLAQFKKRSTSGGTGKKGAKKISMTKEAYNRALLTVASFTAAVVVLVCSLGNLAYKQIRDNTVLNNATYDVRYECIAPETNRTQNNKGYFYDYSDIYRRICDKYSDDVGLYLFYRATNSTHQLDRMVCEGIGGYSDFNNYLAKHGYKSLEEWEKTMKKKTLLQFEDSKIHTELEEIDGEHKEVTIVFDDPPTTEDSPAEFGGGPRR